MSTAVCFAAVFVIVLAITVISMAVNNTMNASAQIEQQQKFFIVIKAPSTDSHDEFKADKTISTSLQGTVLENNYSINQARSMLSLTMTSMTSDNVQI